MHCVLRSRSVHLLCTLRACLCLFRMRSGVRSSTLPLVSPSYCASCADFLALAPRLTSDPQGQDTLGVCEDAEMFFIVRRHIDVMAIACGLPMSDDFLQVLARSNVSPLPSKMQVRTSSLLPSRGKSVLLFRGFPACTKKSGPCPLDWRTHGRDQAWDQVLLFPQL